MSRDHLGIVRRGIDMFYARDFDRMAELAHPDLVWRPAMGTLESREYHGLGGMREYQTDLGVSFRGLGFEIASLEDVGSDTVLVVGRLYRTGSSSGATVSGERGVVVRFRDDKIASIERLPSVADAREEIAGEGAAA